MAKNKITGFQKVAWNLASLTANGFWGILGGYLTYYLTQSVLLSTASVGGILMASKIFDGFTDLIAGYLIERVRCRRTACATPFAQVSACTQGASAPKAE